MDVLALATLLLLLVLPEPGDFAAGESPKLIFCPGFREVGAEDKGRSDPIWLLQKDEEWIPFRNDQQEPAVKDVYQPKKKFFGCFLYHLSAFSHYVLDFFFPPFYGFPYYRVAVEFDPSTGYSVSGRDYDSPSV
ncbi:UNVERIFIED_CONTAM: hypothetical protein PYX00_000324 [Menopon gallinae]|uniref:Uncharacterized protein n=1 Tax=Menopon gallinae TaxID=328185 RepID=A0AAW2I9K0_9NEOP